MFVSAETELKFYSCPIDDTEYHYSPQTPSKITSLSWCRDNCYLVFLSEETNPEIISLKTNQNIRKVHTITAVKDASSIVFQRTTKKSIGIGTSSGQIALYDTKNKGISKLFPSLNSRITCVDFDAQDETMGISCANGTVNILQVNASKYVGTYKTTDGSIPGVVKYHPTENNLLATATEGGSICIWDINTSQKLFSAQMHTNAVGGLALGRQNDLFVSAGLDKKFCVHDLNIKECIFRGTLHQPLSAVDVSSCDNFIVLGTEEGIIYIYDIRYLLQPTNTWKAHNSAVNKIAFAHNVQTDLDTKAHSSKAAVGNKNFRKSPENGKSATSVVTCSQNSDKQLPSLAEHDDQSSSHFSLLVKDVKGFVKAKTEQINSQMSTQFEMYRRLLLEEFKNLDGEIENKWARMNSRVLCKNQDFKDILTDRDQF